RLGLGMGRRERADPAGEAGDLAGGRRSLPHCLLGHAPMTVPEQGPAPRSEITVPRLRDLHPSLRLRIAVGFAERFLNTMVVPLTTVFLARHAGTATVGLLLLATVAVSIVSMLAAGYLAERYGRRRVLVISAALMCAGFTVMAAGAAGPAAWT